MIIPVLGMHRSGTSALAGLLHSSGIVMGKPKEFKPKPLPQNPKGFFENYSIRSLNDQILINQGNNYAVTSWKLPIPKVTFLKKEIKKAARIILDNNKSNSYWGWKDPRTCLTFELWIMAASSLALQNELRPIYIFRSPSAVARSLEVRNNIMQETALALWLEYNKRAYSILKQYKLNTLFICYEELNQDTQRQAERIKKFLNVSFEFKTEFLDSSLNRSGSKKFSSKCENIEVSKFADKLFKLSHD